MLFQQLSVAVDQVLTLIQSDRALLHQLEALVADIGNELSAHVQAFNEKLMGNLAKQVAELLQKTQKKSDFNVKKRL